MELQLRDLQTEPLDHRVLTQAAAEADRLADARLDRLSLVLVDDARIRELNQRFRNVDQPTDVIAFEAEDEDGQRAGEVVVSVETARRQAAEAGSDMETEMAWLVAHGVLHVAGMDDSTDAGLEQMLALQRRALAALGREARP